MPLFSLDNGRLVPATAPEIEDEQLRDEALMAIRDDAIALLYRPLFPVAWLADTLRSGGYRADRHMSLLALDPNQQTVTVDVLPRIDQDSLMAALARAGRHTDLGRGKLSGLYPRGSAAFRRELTDFLDACPANAPTGPRLIILALDIDPNAMSAINSLAGSGVEVQHVTLHESRTGLFVNLNEIRPHAAAFRMLIDSASQRPALTQDTEILSDDDDHADSPSTTEEPEPEAVPSPRPGGRRRMMRLARQQNLHEAGADEPVTESPAEAAPEPEREPEADPEIEPLSDPLPDEVVRSGSTAFVPDKGSRQLAGIASPEEPVSLRFRSRRRRINAVARLTEEGMLILEDGTAWEDPDDAIGALTGRRSTKGWSSWKAEDGATLADLKNRQVRDGGGDADA